MRRRNRWGYAVCVLLLLGSLAQAQQPEPTYYTAVAEWAIERAQWGEFISHFERNSRPVLERMLADGTIVGWGAFEAVVHLEGESTHGIWWTSRTIAGIERTRAELIRLPRSPALLSARMHRDYFLNAALHKAKAGSGSGGYLYVSSYLVQPGKGQQWRQLWDKYRQPVLDELLASGVLVIYGIDTEYVHTADPGLRFVVYVSANAEAEDKIAAAFAAAAGKRSAEENRAITDAFGEVLQAGTHRDFFARLIAWAHK
ncbi:MAG: hypothetical protein K6U02_06140 [Firmicutes bacterium]|nr:hypothetical protein [Bacillota bacterium]